MQFNLFLEKVKLYKKQILSFVIAFILAVAGVFGYNYFIDTSLKVLAGNFDFSYRKIPFDVGHIDFTLSQELDSKTIIKDNFIISPKIDGEVSLVGTNTIRYKFLEKLNVGDDISITLKQGIKSLKGEFLDQEYNYMVSVIESAKVVKIIPEGEIGEIISKSYRKVQNTYYYSGESKLTEYVVEDKESVGSNLSQNIAVFFNIPMVALTNLDEKDKLPCPIEITPKLEGTCKWTTSSVMEFIPRDGFLGATRYKVTVPKTDGLLYKLSSGTTVEVTTPKLQFYVNDTFNASDNIKIRFNFVPSLDSLKDKLKLYELGKEKDIYLSYDKTNESVIVVNLKAGIYKYDTGYKLVFDKGIMPKYGNEPTREKQIKVIKSIPFLNNLEIYQNVFSGGKLYNTRNFDSEGLIPSKNVTFNLSFEEEILDLDKNLFSFEDSKGQKVNFSIFYKKEEVYSQTGAGNIIDNKKHIRLNLLTNLKNSTKYKLIIKKGVNQNLEGDIIKEFTTSSAFEVKNIKFISYSKTCLYLNNKILGDNWNIRNDIIDTIPKSKTSSVQEGEYIDYKDRKEFGIVPYREDELNKLSDDILLAKGYCPRAKEGEILYVLNTRLNPNSAYNIKVDNTIEDIYGSNLSKTYDLNVETGDIQDKDKYLYISLNKEINLIPTNLPLVVNLQTINLDNIDVEVCELDKKEFINYSNKRWDEGYSPVCLKSYNKLLNVKNNHWNLTENKFDIEKDIIGDKTEANFILVRGKAGGRNQFSNVFIRSNLNVTLESGANKKLLFVTDFTGKQILNLGLEFYKYSVDKDRISHINEVYPKYGFNKNTGVYELVGNTDYNYIFVSNGNDLGVVDLNSNIFSDYDFKYYGGAETSDKNYLYLYTERPIYKPGDTVYIKGLLRKFEFNGYKKSDLSKGRLEVLDSNYITISSMDITLDKNSNFNTSFIIPKELSLGKFSFRFTSGTNDYYRNDAYFHIEEYRKPDFKIEFSSLNKDYQLGDKLSFQVLPQYYFGGNLVSTKGQYSVLKQNYYFDAKDYSNYQFGNGYGYFDCIYWGYCSYDDSLGEVKEFRVDENGKATISYGFSNKEEEGEKIYSFNVEVEDKDTKKTVNKSVSTIVHNTDGYVGIDHPYWNEKKKGITAEFVVLDYEAKPLASKDIKVEIIKRDWKVVKKQGVDGYFYDDYSLEEKKESDFNLKTNNNGIIKETFITKDSGEYTIKAIYTGKNGKSFISSSYVYVAGDDYVSWYNPNNDTTEMVAEKPQVLVGEKAVYTLKTPINSGKAFIVIEKDDGILDYFIHDIKSYGDRIIIPVKSTYYPNYYVRAFIIGSEKGNNLPIYKRALISTKVSTEYKRMKVTLLKDKQSYKPGDKIGIGVVVNDSKGNPIGGANGSISIVDESLLALVGNPKKNPYAFFYDMKRYLGTVMYSSMINLIEKLEVKDITNGEKGGAGEQIKGGDSKKKRGVFKDTAFWQADFTTGPNGKVYIQSDNLPDNLTTWVVEVIVNTPEDNKIGIAYETFTTSKHVIINDNLPNFFGVGDDITLSPVIFNKTGKDGDFELTLDATNIKVKGGNKRKLFVKNGESKVVNFDIKVYERNSFIDINKALSKVNFKISEICEKNCNDANSDEIEKVVLIKDSTTKESVATIGNTKDASFDEHINIGKLKDKIGQININYSATLFNNLIDSIDYLNNYPYGCAEQKTSAIMPNVFIKKLYDSVGIKYDLKTKMLSYFDDYDKIYRQKSIDQVIKEYIVDIRKYQKNDGGFVYWNDIDESYYPNYSNFALTSYMLKSMSEIGKIGYKQDEKIMINTVSYLKERFNKNYREGCIISKYNDCKYTETERLIALEALQNYNPDDYDTYKMYKLLVIKKDDTSSILQNALVVSNLLKIKSLKNEEKELLRKQVNDDIKKIVNNELVFNPRGAYVGKTSGYTRIENTSILLKVLSLLGEKEIDNASYLIDNLNRWIITQKKNGSFGSTQDNMKVIDAISYYMSVSSELKDINFNTKLKLNGDNIDEKIINDKNKLEVFSKTIDLKKLQDQNILNISKIGKGKVYYDLSMDYFLPSKSVQSRDEGLAVIKEYFDYNEYKKIDSLKKEEWLKYIKGKISFDELKYKKSTYEYLSKLTFFKVGQLVIVRNKIITPETRDKVAFEGFIPAGAELINPNLATSSKAAFSFGNNIFERNEYRLDRFFGYTSMLYSGIYDVSYLIRFTHAGEYYLKPSYISEFYNAEVFGRSAGEMIIVK